jgi:glycosyltransferase involved in cell wall biosynthesis
MKKNIKQILPLISVIMPVYNAGDYLVPAVESILHQTYQNFEFIIIDDASTDNSLDVLRRYKKLYPDKIKLLALKKNRNHGGDRCVNQGLKLAKGKYIARMDADDIAVLTRLEKQVTFLETHPDIFLVGSSAHVIDSKGNTIGEKLEPNSTKDIYNAYFTFHPLIHPTCMFRRIHKGIEFRYNIKFSANNDYYTFFGILCKGYKFINLDEKLLYYRIHGKNDTFVNMKQKFSNTLKIRYEIVTKYGYKPSPRALLITIFQSLAIYLLPEKMLRNLYFLAKGITKKEQIVFQLNPYGFISLFGRKILAFTS